MFFFVYRGLFHLRRAVAPMVISVDQKRDALRKQLELQRRFVQIVGQDKDVSSRQDHNRRHQHPQAVGDRREFPDGLDLAHEFKDPDARLFCAPPVSQQVCDAVDREAVEPVATHGFRRNGR